MSFTSQVTTIVPGLAEATHSESAINPWFVGIGVFVVLLAMMAGLLAFGAGRDHS